MIIIEVVRNWRDPGPHIELPGVPRLGDEVLVNTELSGTVEEVVWEPGQPVRVRLG